MSLKDERREYRYGRLNRAGLLESPYAQFDMWMQQAQTAGINDATAMVLASVDAAGQPRQRTVLLKGIGQQGLTFFTNLNSTKAREMATNTRVSVLFPWLALDRQVSVMGTVTSVAVEDAQAYFHSRPRESQLAAWTSAQSQPIESRAVLDADFEAASERFKGQEIPMPEFWGGFYIAPTAWEFWQGGENRLHDRFRYSQGTNDAWIIERLSP
jgi:pyridoxamine 5'-phosphate oxidase